MAANIDGFGAVTWWGFSPALDLGDLKQKGIKNTHIRTYRTSSQSVC